jgi:hydrogenase expression/formation protein HypC
MAMCLAIPGRILSVEASDPDQSVARVDFEGQVKTVSLLYVPDAGVGDYVIVQSGFAIRRMDKAEALEALALARETTVDGMRRESAETVPSSPAVGGET